MLALPFVRIGGESALRFDVPTLQLHAFGATIWMDELFVVLAATLCATFAFLLVTVLFGRLWCGWACPQTALVDITGFVAAARRKGGWRVPVAFAASAVASAIVGANLIWYFIEPAEFFRRVATLSLGPVVGWSWLVIGGVVFADLVFWRQRFCATTCPYAKLQGALLDRSSMVIAYDARRDDDCIDCKACVRVCPVGIDIRDGLQAECTSCGECIDACAPIMARLKRAPKLVGYFFGAPGAARRLLRPGVLALAALTAVSLGLTVVVAAERTALEMTVTSAGEVLARRSSSGETYHAFAIALENRGREPLHLDLALRAPGIAASVKPAEVVLAPGEHRRVRLVAVVSGLDAANAVGAELSAVARGGARVRADRAVTLSAPRVLP